MFVCISDVVDAVHPDANNFVIRYRASRRCFVSAIEGVNNTKSPQTITLCLGSAGADDLQAGIALKEGVSLGGGFGLQWTGKVELSSDEEIFCDFIQADVADKVQLKVKVEHE
jgi:hypothetical protein